MSKTQEAAHTPGPWTLFHHEASGTRYIDAGTVQMQITRTSDAGASQMDANARLIAAAPELLDALVALYAVARVDRNESYSAIANAAAVIAKATGAAAPTAPSLALTAFIQDVEAAEGKATGAQA